jgi:ribose transport system ATP-binding protein
VTKYRRDDLIRGITGSSANSVIRSQTLQVSASQSPLLELRSVCRAPRVSNVSFDLFPGEILGLAGLVGAGRTEVLRLIFGSERLSGGQMLLDGKPFAPSHPSDAIASGFALVPEERRSQALVMNESIDFNMNVGNWRPSRFLSWLPLLDDREAQRRSIDMAQLLRVKTKSVSTAVRKLSGGNQQKVVFGRWLLRGPRVLLLDEPTRGVDIGARHQIWETISAFAARGGSVVVVSSDLEELSVCHRVVILVEGRSVGEIHGPNISEDQMLERIYQCEGSHVW